MRCKFSNGTFLVLAWSALINVASFGYTGQLLSLFPFPAKLNDYLVNFYSGLLVLLPVAGWIGDSLLGRYRAITVGFVLLTIEFLVFLGAFILLQLNWSPVIAFLLLFCSLPLVIFGLGTVFTNSLPFIIDQMLGATADDISAAVEWYYWAAVTGFLIQNFPVCLSLAVQFNLLSVSLSLTFLSLSTILITDRLCYKQLDDHFKSGNPLKTIFQVLNYARKTKYPEHRSALTYIDEEEPSRLDYGKQKFGGPFTEEEVEDVKTLLRLLPLFFTTFGFQFAFLTPKQNLLAHTIRTTIHSYECVGNLKHLIFAMTGFCSIPIYRFIVFPLVRLRLPSLLKRIGGGLLLCCISSLLNLSIDTIGHLQYNNTECMFQAGPESTSFLPVPLYWPVISDVISSIGTTIATCCSVEFIMAQSPNTMRAVMMGIAITLFGVYYLIHHGLLYGLLKHSSYSSLSCGFYYYLVLSILTILSLVLFAIAAKRYKLRERDRHVNIHVIVEDHFDRYFDQEEKHMKGAARLNIVQKRV